MSGPQFPSVILSQVLGKAPLLTSPVTLFGRGYVRIEIFGAKGSPSFTADMAPLEALKLARDLIRVAREARG